MYVKQNINRLRIVSKICIYEKKNNKPETNS